MIDYLLSLDFRQQVAITIAAGIIAYTLTKLWKGTYRYAERQMSARLHRPTLMFVSTGGTCRDPMAKVIAEELLREMRPTVRVYAAGISKGHSERAAKAARYVVREATGKDLLEDHRTRALDRDLVAKSDLILAMEPVYVREIVKLFPDAKPKTHTIHSFLGLRGVIENPYRAPDEIDEKALARYRSCFNELRVILSANIEKIHSAVTLQPRPMESEWRNQVD